MVKKRGGGGCSKSSNMNGSASSLLKWAGSWWGDSVFRLVIVLLTVFMISSLLVFVGLEGFWEWKVSYVIGKGLSAVSGVSPAGRGKIFEFFAEGRQVAGSGGVSKEETSTTAGSGKPSAVESGGSGSSATYSSSFSIQSGTTNCVNISDSASVEANPNITKYTSSSLYEFEVNGSVTLCNGFYNVNIPEVGSLFWVNRSDVEINLNGSTINGTGDYRKNYVVLFGHNSPDSRQYEDFILRDGEIRGLYSVIGSSFFTQLNYSNFVIKNITFPSRKFRLDKNYTFLDFPLIKDSRIESLNLGTSQPTNITAIYANKMYNVTINNSRLEGVKYSIKVGEMSSSLIVHNFIGVASGAGIWIDRDTCFGSGSLCPRTIVYDNYFSYSDLYVYGGILSMNVTYQCSPSITNIIGGNCLGGNAYRELILRDNGKGKPPFHDQSGDGIADDLAPIFANYDDGGNIDFLPLTNDGSEGYTYTGAGGVIPCGGFAVLGNVTISGDDYNISESTKFAPSLFVLMYNDTILDCSFSNFTGDMSEWRDVKPVGIKIYSPLKDGLGLANGTIIRNCNFDSVVKGILAEGEAGEFTIVNVTVRNSKYGFENYPQGNEYKVSYINSSSFVNNTYGVYLRDASDGGGIVISDCTISNSERYGIYISPGYHNATIKNSYIYSNGDLIYSAIKISGTHNLFYNNNISNNDVNIQTTNADNYFNITKTLGTNIIGGPYLGGNSWGDYDGGDVDGDGLGESAYAVSGGGVDYLPLAELLPPLDLSDDSAVDYHPYIEKVAEGQFEVTGNVVLDTKDYSGSLSDGAVFFFKNSDISFDCNGSSFENSASSRLGKGIEINVSLSDITINNCTFKHYGDGIYLNVQGDVSKNVSRLMIANSTFENNSRGIYLSGIVSSQLKSNTIMQSVFDGVFLQYAYHNLFHDNVVYDNVHTGSVFSGVNVDSAEYNNFTSNNISQNGLGSLSVGLFFSTATSNNLVYNNYFDNADHNARSKSGNRWNISKTAGNSITGGAYWGGNYWSDYTGEDTDGDGIGNSVYTLPDGEVDYLPLTEDWSCVHLDNDTEVADHPNITKVDTGQFEISGSLALCVEDYSWSLSSSVPLFKIAGNNLVFDCNGATVTNSYSSKEGYGIKLEASSDNVTIKDCSLSGYSYGVYANSVVQGDSIKGLIVANSIFDSNEYGLYLKYVDNSQIKSNVIKNSEFYGIYVGYSNHNLFYNNVVYKNAQGAGNYRGILVQYVAMYNNFTLNNISSNGVDSGDAGLTFEGMDAAYNLVYNNYFRNIVNALSYSTTNKFNSTYYL